MQVQVYRGSGRVFAVIEEGSDARLPERYGPWALFKPLELVRGQPQPGLHVDECLDDIARHGIHVTDAHTRITEQAIG
jgi:hypothetical protein